MDSEGTQEGINEGTHERPENRTPKVMRLGFREHPYVPRCGGEGSESEDEDDAVGAASNTEWLTSTPYVNPGAARGQPRVMRLGLDSRGGGPRVNWTRELTGRGGGEGTSGRQDSEGAEPRVMRLGLESSGGEGLGQEQRRSMDEPSVLRLARNSNVYLDYSDSGDDSDEDGGGGDDQPPLKRSKRLGVAETSSLSTSSSEIPYQVMQGENNAAEEEEFNNSRLLLTLSPIDRLGQLIREDQTREDGSAIEVHKICSSTPYFFQVFFSHVLAAWHAPRFSMFPMF